MFLLKVAAHPYVMLLLRRLQVQTKGRRRSEQGPAAPCIRSTACRTGRAGCFLVSPDDSADILFLMFAADTTRIVKLNTWFILRLEITTLS